MTNNLMNKLDELKSAIEQDSSVLELERLNKIINADENVMRLAYRKDMAVLAYEDALKHYTKDSLEVGNAQKSLYEAKLALDSNPLVIQYNDAYKKVKAIYTSINEELFGSVSIHSCGENHD